MKITQKLKTLFILTMSMLCIQAYAQEQKPGAAKDLSLKDLLDVKITTVSKSSQNLDLAPATVIVITQEQIRERGYHSLLDVMYDLPDVKVDDKIYSGMRNSFVVRGTRDQDKFIMLLDGICISSPSGEPMPVMENYPVNLAEQIEIVFGPASALYGANAVSGVINIITRKNMSGKDLSVDASTTAGTYGYSNHTLYLAKNLGNNASLVLSGQYSYDRGADYSKIYPGDSLYNVDGYPSGTLNSIYGPMTPVKKVTAGFEAPMNAYNVFAAFKTGDFTLSVFRNSTTTPSALGNNTNNAVYNKDSYLEQNVSVVNATFAHQFNKITSTSRLSASQYNLEPNSNYRNLYTNMEPGYKFSTTSQFSAEQQLDIKVMKNFDITGGVSYELYNSIPQSTDLSAPVNKNDYIKGYLLGTQSYYCPEGLPAVFYITKYYNAGNYIQLQYAAGKSLSFTLGARYDVNSRYGNTFNPRVGVVFKPFPKTTLKALFGSAFLAANPTTAYAQYGAFETADSGKTYHANFLHLPNPDLKPIRSKNFELNLKQYMNDNLSVTVDGYYTILTNLYVFADDNTATHLYNNMYMGIPVDYIEVFVNKAKQVNYGGSIQFDFREPVGKVRTNTYVTFSYVNGVWKNGMDESGVMQKDVALEGIAPFMMHLGTDLKTGKFTFSPRLSLIGKQNIGGTSKETSTLIERQTIPGYTLLNLSARYSINKHWAVYATAQNALNQVYKSVGYSMDLNAKPTELFYGQKQDPLRIYGGVNVNF